MTTSSSISDPTRARMFQEFHEAGPKGPPPQEVLPKKEVRTAAAVSTNGPHRQVEILW